MLSESDKTKRSWNLGGGGSSRRRDDVDNVGRLLEAEIFVTDEAHGRRSRGEGGAFAKTKGGSRVGLASRGELRRR